MINDKYNINNLRNLSSADESEKRATKYWIMNKFMLLLFTATSTENLCLQPSIEWVLRRHARVTGFERRAFELVNKKCVNKK